MIEQSVYKFFSGYNLFTSNNIILIAFSGGIDSTCLTHFTYKLHIEFGFKLLAAHINHQWRKEDSFKDQNFVAEFCNNLNIPFYMRLLDPNIPKSEHIARTKRYEALNEIANEHNANILLTAHNKSDQVETIIFRILKGSGHSGLIGIPEKREQFNGPTIYRPLLSSSREEIKDYLARNNLQYMEDITNYDQSIARNSIRHSLIPKLKNYNGQVEEAFLKLSFISEQNDRIINHFLEPVYQRVFDDDNSLITSEFLNLEEFIKPHILIKLLNINNIDYDYKTIHRLLNYINQTKLTVSGKKYSLLKNFFLHINQKNIKIVGNNKINMVQSSSQLAIPGITELKELNIVLKVTEFDNQYATNISFPPANADYALVDLTQVNAPLYLRTRKPGDFIQPLGMNGHMKLKKFLINHHIDRNLKDSIPIIAYDSEVLWAVGIGLSDKVKVVDVPTHVLKIIRG